MNIVNGIVDRLHVSASGSEVRAAVRAAFKPGTFDRMDPRMRARVMRVAVSRHKRNANLYLKVMGGHI